MLFRSLVHEVKRKYKLKQNGTFHINTFTDCFATMLKDEILYGQDWDIYQVYRLTSMQFLNHI